MDIIDKSDMIIVSKIDKENIMILLENYENNLNL
jgi:hypothetical protein